MNEEPGPRKIAADHEHRWMFLMTKNAFERENPPIIPDQKADDTRLMEFLSEPVYRMVEYAYLICNGCTTVMKKPVKTAQQVDRGNV